MVSFLFSTRSLTEFSKNIPIDKNNRDDKDLNRKYTSYIISKIKIIKKKIG